MNSEEAFNKIVEQLDLNELKDLKTYYFLVKSREKDEERLRKEEERLRKEEERSKKAKPLTKKELNAQMMAKLSF